ncbi:MAG TPA: hypothetical protein VNH19_13570 [Candidatus Limnocylindrales bacterium]|nr:hypothetical protein [Candidatus Limnocylindrales bacterium]
MKVSSEFYGALSSKLLIHHSRLCWLSLIIGTILLIVAFPFATTAQVACIPPPTNRVPGLPGPPDWGTLNPPNTPTKTGLDDPRWDGAGSLTFANGTSGDTAQFRALASGGKLFLSWQVVLPPQSPAAANVVYVGFTQAGGTPTHFAMTINLHSTTPSTDTTDYDLGAWSVDSAGVPTTLGFIPAWVNNTRVWITNSNFAVQMIVPISTAGISSGVNLGTDFKMWFEMQESLPPATPATVWDAVFPDGRGGTPIATDVTSPFAIQYPAPSSWATFHQSTGPGDPACTLGGISINESQIGTHNPIPHEILFSKVGVNTLVNTFFASPTNGMTTPIPAGGLTATFRIADWGSTYDPNAPYTLIPGGQDVPSTALIPGGGTTAANTNITFNWIVQDILMGEQWLTEFRGGKEPDQCMLVTLAGGTLVTWQASHIFNLGDTIVDPMGNLQKVTVAGKSGGTQPPFNGVGGGTTPDNAVTWTNAGPAIGPGLTFLNNSVLTNMDFVGASRFERAATINIQNLAPLGSAPRDVYLYVVTANMPSIVEATWKDLYNKLFGTPDQRNSQKTQEVLNRMSRAQVNEAVPSYRVFVFHDSGKKIKVQSKDYLIVHPQSGFGYFVLPHADVNGWVTALQGATQIANNLYRIAVPNNGVAKVTTKINAVEILPKNCFGHIKWPAASILLVGIFLLGFVVYPVGSKRH